MDAPAGVSMSPSHAGLLFVMIGMAGLLVPTMSVQAMAPFKAIGALPMEQRVIGLHHSLRDRRFTADVL